VYPVVWEQAYPAGAQWYRFAQAQQNNMNSKKEKVKVFSLSIPGFAFAKILQYGN
jgi:hypothetical protein